MRQKLLSEAAAFLVKNRRRRMWTKVVSCMAAVVVFCTTYVLILPALTLEKDTECGYEEHVHTEACYLKGDKDVSDGSNIQVVSGGDVSAGDEGTYCGKHAHKHTTACFGDSDTTADVETEEDWKASFADVTLTGNWAQDVVAIAQSQVGYKESEDNFFYDAEEKKLNGYTRYGAWYGDEYGDWNAMFVAFCLNYAQVTDYPVDVDCAEWVELLSQEEYDLYRPASEYTPVAGDLIFLDSAKGDGIANYVGIVESVTSSGEGAAQLNVIEGDSLDEVKRISYKANDASILGYGRLLAQLSKEERTLVDYVIRLIAEMPSADEIDAKIEEFEDAEDYEGEEAWLTEVYQQVAIVYHRYSRLSENQKAYVTNVEKLLELEYIWSMTPYAATNTIPIYQINSYFPDNGYDPSYYAALLIWGGSFDEVVQNKNDWMLDIPFDFWDAIVAEKSGNSYKIKEYYTNTSDKSTLSAPDGGFVLIFTNDSTHDFYLSSISVKVGDMASIDFDYTKYGGGYNEGNLKNGQYNGVAYGTVTFGTETAVVGDNPVSIAESATTSAFIELNLYDYYGDASASAAGKDTVNSLWNSNNQYPGFQWNGGAYPLKFYGTGIIPGNAGLVDRNVVDNIDFGNSIITDYKFSEETAFGNPSKSKQSVGYANSDSRGVINRIEYDTRTNGWGITNRPIGMSTLSNPVYGDRYTQQYFSEVLERTLNEDGYPQLKNIAGSSGSLGYLFSESDYAKKINNGKGSIDGLFQYDEDSGAYYYNSRENHAQYNSSTNTFTLYNQIITPNFILYPFGNFLPFNDITNGNTTSLVGRITVNGNTYGYDYAGGGQAYIEKIINRLDEIETYDYYGFNTEEQLRYMLEKYKENWKQYDYNNTYWSGTKTSTLINDFFNTEAELGESPNVSVDFGSGTLKNTIDKMYNIDYNVEKNFFFGMEMKMNFYQPAGGMTGKDKKNNVTGATGKDGIPDYPMEFYFTGDDDVWVYIDDVLFLDLSGIHRHVGGKIDFVNGRVYYQYLSIGSGDVSSATAYTPYGATEGNYYTFAELLKAGGIAENDLGKYLKKDSSGKYTTFIDYSTHSFKFYYMERGSGSSVCRLSFNFPLVQQNTITVEKELESDVDVLGNSDFTFQVLDADDNSPFLEQHDLDGYNWAYSLYEGDHTIQKIRIVDKNPDGTVKKMEVYQGNKIVREEYQTYDEKGKLITVIEDHPENGTVLTVDDEGKFTLKAGQRAEFVGIAESWGEYYVREILPDNIDEQYGSVTVTGETTTTAASKVKIDSSEFVGFDSTVQNSNVSNTFKFTNKINTVKLGKLSISKTVEATYFKDTSKEFEFYVTLDDEPLPVGTSYTVGEETKTVAKDQEGIIKLKHNETAIIANIIAGTKFNVTETTTTSSGYQVTYTPLVEGKLGASGVIDVGTTAEVKVENTEISTSVNIPIAKTMSCFSINDTPERTYQFVIEQVADSEGNALAAGEKKYSYTTDSLAEPNRTDIYTKYTFQINYTANDVTENQTKTFFYKIFEKDGNELVDYDTKYYIIKVEVKNNGTEISADVKDVWKVDGESKTHIDGKSISDTTILFTNTILRKLNIEKTVSGGTANDETKDFMFTLKLEEYESNVDLPTALIGTKNTTSGTTEVNYPLDDKEVHFTLKHGESITFTNIPYKSRWTVTETIAEGFSTTYTVTTTSTIGGNGNVVSEQVASANTTTVKFTNTSNYKYELPETGGTGTNCYIMAGLMLILFSVAYLMYTRANKRKEVS